MFLKIIDNKKISLTDSEYILYQEICQHYTRPNFQGRDVFRNLFETDPYGNLIFLRPPQDPSHLEAYLFLVSVMVHQHLGHGALQLEAALKKTEETHQELKATLSQAQSLILELKSSRDG